MSFQLYIFPYTRGSKMKVGKINSDIYYKRIFALLTLIPLIPLRVFKEKLYQIVWSLICNLPSIFENQIMSVPYFNIISFLKSFLVALIFAIPKEICFFHYQQNTFIYIPQNMLQHSGTIEINPIFYCRFLLLLHWKISQY